MAMGKNSYFMASFWPNLLQSMLHIAKTLHMSIWVEQNSNSNSSSSSTFSKKVLHFFSLNSKMKLYTWDLIWSWWGGHIRGHADGPKCKIGFLHIHRPKMDSFHSVVVYFFLIFASEISLKSTVAHICIIQANVSTFIVNRNEWMRESYIIFCFSIICWYSSIDAKQIRYEKWYLRQILVKNYQMNAQDFLRRGISFQFIWVAFILYFFFLHDLYQTGAWWCERWMLWIAFRYKGQRDNKIE